MSPLLLRRACAFFGTSGIAAAAFGSHGLSEIASPEQVRWWAIAVSIQLVTLPVILLIAVWKERLRSISGWLLLAGVGVFSGSLYAMALGAPRVLGAVTPLGGLLLMAGWLLIAWPPAKSD